MAAATSPCATPPVIPATVTGPSLLSVDVLFHQNMLLLGFDHATFDARLNVAPLTPDAFRHGSNSRGLEVVLYFLLHKIDHDAAVQVRRFRTKRPRAVCVRGFLSPLLALSSPPLCHLSTTRR